MGATAPLSHTMERTHDAGVLSYLRFSTDRRSCERQPARGEANAPAEADVAPPASAAEGNAEDGSAVVSPFFAFLSPPALSRVTY